MLSYNPYFFAPNGVAPLWQGYICAAKSSTLASLSVCRQRGLTAFASSFRHPCLSPSESRSWQDHVWVKEKEVDPLQIIRAFARRINQVQGKLYDDGALRGKYADGEVLGTDILPNVFFGCPSHGVALASESLDETHTSDPYAKAWCVVYNLLMRPSHYAKGKETTLSEAVGITSPLLHDTGVVAVFENHDPFAFYGTLNEVAVQVINLPLDKNYITELPEESQDAIDNLDVKDSIVSALRNNPALANIVIGLPTIMRARARSVKPLSPQEIPSLILDPRAPFGARVKTLAAAMLDPTLDQQALFKAAQRLAASVRTRAHKMGIKPHNEIKGKRTR